MSDSRRTEGRNLEARRDALDMVQVDGLLQPLGAERELGAEAQQEVIEREAAYALLLL